MTVSVKHSTSADSSFSSTGATAWNADHTLTGLGTMAEQNANNVAITGGAVDGATVGATTASTGRFTTITSTIATGTAPFTVASTTPVTNLNIGGNAATASKVQYALTAGTNITFSSGTTYDGSAAITINATGGGGMVYPGAGIPNSTGSAWGTSYTTTGSGTVVALATSPSFTTPILGTPQSGNFSTGTFTWPTFNQNTTGTAANITATSNSTLTTLSSLSLPGSQVSGNISGNAANVTGTVAIANGGTGSATLAGASIVTYTGSETLTNKRIDPRVTSAASASTLTPSIATADVYAYTALAAGLTINAPTGTPVDGDKLIFRILDNGTARALTWDATYTVIGVTLPTTTTANKTTYVGCIYNANNTRWDVIAVTTQA
jgi:hypothetical protein